MILIKSKLKVDLYTSKDDILKGEPKKMSPMFGVDFLTL